MATLAQQGWRMPAEWEKQSRIWIAWPHQRADWPGKFAPIPFVYAEIARHIAAGEKVGLIVRDAKEKQAASELLENVDAKLENIDFLIAPTNRVWLRDSGPIFVKHKKTGEIAALDFKFNAWAKYSNWKHDNELPTLIAKQQKKKRFAVTHKGKPVVMEGGALDVNGKGSILVTEECLLSDVQVRNKAFTRADYEQVFADWLGAPNTIWLEAGIVGDDTHGHIDDITRFVSADTMVTCVETNKRDENYAILSRNLKMLEKAKDERGKALNIAELPMPKALSYEGQRIPASYANFLITNHAVLVPTFNDANDRIALNTLGALFPTREIIGIHAVDLVWGLGTLHCLSQQQPA